MKRSILFCINSLQIGGAEQLLIDKINNWPQEDDIHLALFSDENILLDKIKRDVKVYKIIKPTNFKKIMTLRKYLLSNKIDYVISHLEKPNKVALFSSIMTRVKVFPVLHSINIYPKKSAESKIASIIYKVLSKKSIAISNSVYNYLVNDLKLKKDHVVLIENGVDFNRIDFINKVAVLPKKREFFTLGRLVEPKGYDFMIRSLGNNSIKDENWHLTIIGDGAMRSKLEELIEEYELAEKVSVIGSKTSPFNFVKQGSICLMPSRKEGLPIALLEILSKSIPVLSSDIKPLALVEEEFNGFKFASENEKSFVKSFDSALNIDFENYKKLSDNAFQSVQKFNISNCINNYKNLLH